MRPTTTSLRALLLAACVALAGCTREEPTTTQRQADTGGCTLPSLVCAGVCRDLTTDRAHCGACGRACGAAEVCSRGACAASCGLGLTRCASDDSCRDLQSDPHDCGACGRACGAGQVCSRGVCAPACDASLAACGAGACRDLMTDPHSCGACGRVCTAGELCTSGACALPGVCALGTATNTTALVDQAQRVSSTLAAALVGPTLETGAGQGVTVARAGFLSGVEVSLTTCGGALTSSSSVQLTVLDELGQIVAVATRPAAAVTNGACPNLPPSLTAGVRSRATFDLGAQCVPVRAGRRLRFVVTSTGATTNGTCPTGAGARYCTNGPTVPCTSNAQCAGLPAIVRAGMDPASSYDGGAHTVGAAEVTGADLAFVTWVTPAVTHCAGETSCNGTCRDLTSDRLHCGACGRACSSSQVCSSGVCRTTCGAGLTSCARGGVAYCANLQSDNVNCGACGAACAPGQVCARGACVTTCGAGATTCGAGAAAYCALTSTDNANCGRCGNACPAGTVCSNGACAPTCAAPTTRCGAACVDTRWDPAHCGACGNACDAGAACVQGACASTCGAFARCGAGALARCADLQNDAAHCGACGQACPAGQLCAAGACGVACGAGAVRCDLGEGPYCAVVASDNNNCGACGVRCGAGNACVGGGCAVTCGPGLTECDERCVDARHDPANCGACGRACAAGQVCTQGACADACAPPDTRCGARCVDPRSNPDHCGACGRACPAAGPDAVRVCGDATCGALCVPGRGDCDGALANGCEVDLRVTTSHCGACGRACALPHATARCDAGRCAVAQCAPEWADCNGVAEDGCELHLGASCSPAGGCMVGRVACRDGAAICEGVGVLPQGTTCRPAAGPCDVEERCDGSSPTCPPDGVAPSSVCPTALEGGGTSTAAGECLALYTFAVEHGQTYTVSTCAAFTGDPLVRVSGACVCESDDACGTGARCSCTATESGIATVCATTYPGTSATWRYEVTSSNNRCGAATQCRPAAGPCDAPETCDGVGAACPVDRAVPEGGACEDGNRCTVGDTCRGGACAPGPAPSCVEGACSGSTCDPATGRCVAKTDGTHCDDGNADTRDDACWSGVCGGASVAPATRVAAGIWSSHVLTNGAEAWAFGARPGAGTAEDGSRVPVRVASSEPFSWIAQGFSTVLATRWDGSVYAWGDNRAGQLGDGTTTSRSAPAQVPGLTQVDRVAAGSQHSLASTFDGVLYAWGSNAYGELGDATAGTRLSPARVPVSFRAREVAAGDGFSLALDAEGGVWAWGINSVGQLGDGSTTSRATPARVAGLPMITAVAAGYAHALALAADGSVWAWGFNGSGQLGDGSVTVRTTPQRVGALSGVASIAAGSFHSLAVRVDGTLWGWGDSGAGQLGVGPFTAPGVWSPHGTPARVGDLTGVSQVAGGFDHTIALATDGRVWTIGGNQRGQLGDDTTHSPRTSFETVVGFGRARVNVLTQGYDTHRTGANTREATLHVGNVRPQTFGRLYSAAVDGQVHAQPLFVGGAYGGRDVLYVATERNSLYAIDAADGAVIWQRNYGLAFDQVTQRPGVEACASSINPVAGITSTPAVDLATQTLYFVAKRDLAGTLAAPSASAAFELHAVDMVTGADRRAPVRIEATITRADVGAADSALLPMSTSRSLVFEPVRHYQRPALLLQDGQLWVAFGGTCDILPYHGWVMTYDAATLARTGAWVSSSVGDPACVMSAPTCEPGTAGTYGTAGANRCCASGAGIWASGRGPASRGTGDVYITTGNTFVVHPPDGVDMSNAVVRLGRSASTGDVVVRDWYVPWNWQTLDAHDSDLSSAGVTLIPGTNLLLATGKSADFWVLNASSLGHYTPPPSMVTGPVPEPGVLQRFYLEGQNAWSNIGLPYNGTVFWNDRAYLWPSSLPVMAWPLDRATSTFACPRGLTYPDPRVPICAGEVNAASAALGSQRTNITVSANGAQPGTGVLWSTVPDCDGELVAYDAQNLAAGPLYTSRMDNADHLGNYETMASPVVAGGRVFVATRGAVVAYGLLPSPRATLTPRSDSACACPTATLPTVVTPAWSDLYEAYFGPTVTGVPGATAGCQSAGCHRDPSAEGGFAMGTSAQNLFDQWVGFGWLNPSAPRNSRLLDSSTSRIKWVNPTGARMPRNTLTRCNAQAVADLRAWIEDWARRGTPLMTRPSPAP